MSIALIFLLACLSSINGDVVVQTTHGDVRGLRLNISVNKSIGSDFTHVDMYLGIPYAKPPVGGLRFARPVSKSPWKPKELDATRVSPSCPQPQWFLRTYSFGPSYQNLDEDCLYLNVYSPHSTFHTNHTVYPVMVWIHGGAYKYGSGAEYDGRILAQQGVVVVTLNYRLSALGFLSTDDDHAPGNYGLLDQLMALEWVKKNAANFQGDPNRITIFGQSAGGGSVSLHMFSPRAKGLFQSVIPQSGCALSPWAIYRPPHKSRTYATSLAQELGCTTSSSADMITCLRRKSASSIANARVGAPPMISTFAPRVDGYYINDLPEVLLERGAYMTDVQVMTGYVPQELAEELEGQPRIDDGMTVSQLESLFSGKSSRYMSNANTMYNALVCAYPPSPTDKFRNRDYGINMISDYGYVAPHIKLAEAMRKHGTNVWLYDFTFRSALSKTKDWIGVPHAAELYYEFGAPFLQRTHCPTANACPSSGMWGNFQPWGANEEAVSRLTMKVWSEFAKLSHDADIFKVTLNDDVIYWPPYKNGVGTILNITSNTALAHLKKSKGIRFWESYNYLNLTAPVPDMCGIGVPVGR